MADFWTVSGWGLSVALGGLNMWQFIRDYGEGKAWKERARSLAAVKLGLVQLRAMLTEAGEKREIIKSEGGQAFLHAVGHHIKSIEHHVDGMLEP